MTDCNVESKGSILVVDDDVSITRALRATLVSLGYAVDEASSGERGIQLAGRGGYNAILLDINMPGIGGIEACREIRRQKPRAGILMLTVRDSVDDKVEALEAGADDYITKPFAIRELIARMRTVHRARSNPGDSNTVLAVGEIQLDSASHTVLKAGKRIQVTPKEFEILEYLMRRAGRVVRHEELLRAIWGPDYGGELEYLRTFVHQLRRKIESDPAHPQYVMTDAFVGYRFLGPSGNSYLS